MQGALAMAHAGTSEQYNLHMCSHFGIVLDISKTMLHSFGPLRSF